MKISIRVLLVQISESNFLSTWSGLYGSSRTVYCSARLSCHFGDQYSSLTMCVERGPGWDRKEWLLKSFFFIFGELSEEEKT